MHRRSGCIRRWEGRCRDCRSLGSLGAGRCRTRLRRCLSTSCGRRSRQCYGCRPSSFGILLGCCRHLEGRRACQKERAKANEIETHKDQATCRHAQNQSLQGNTPCSRMLPLLRSQGRHSRDRVRKRRTLQAWEMTGRMIPWDRMPSTTTFHPVRLRRNGVWMP